MAKERLPGMVDKRCAVPRGKGLGGSTIINSSIYARGSKLDYDSWSKAGNAGWSFEEVLPYFKKSENSQIDGDPGYHGKGGLLNVENEIPISPVAEAFISANLELGRQIVDYNGRNQLGVSYIQYNTLDGSRLSTGKAFLTIAKRRKNLKVLTYSYATKILINSNKTAYGVVFSHDGITNIARAHKETIISAGAIGSPHLLLLSGIGPANVLAALGIRTVINLPVGENLQDHPSMIPLKITTNHSEPVKTLYENSKDYLNGIGDFTFPFNMHAVAFLKTAPSVLPPSVPDIEAILIFQNLSNYYQQQALHYSNNLYNEISSGLNETKTLTIYVSLLHPKSRGRITLASSNPYEYPNIDFNFFSDKANKDIKTLYRGIKIVERIIDTASFKEIDAQLYYPALPPCSNYTYLSKEQWYCNIHQLATQGLHPIGTCKMAPQDTGGVVDNQLRVYGIRNLRVADASIFPSTTSGHTCAPAIMVGEKLADMLKNEQNVAQPLKRHKGNLLRL